MWYSMQCFVVQWFSMLGCLLWYSALYHKRPVQWYSVLGCVLCYPRSLLAPSTTFTLQASLYPSLSTLLCILYCIIYSFLYCIFHPTLSCIVWWSMDTIEYSTIVPSPFTANVSVYFATNSSLAQELLQECFRLINTCS